MYKKTSENGLQVIENKNKNKKRIKKAERGWRKKIYENKIEEGREEHSVGSPKTKHYAVKSQLQ